MENSTISNVVPMNNALYVANVTGSIPCSWLIQMMLKEIVQTMLRTGTSRSREVMFQAGVKPRSWR